VAEQPFKKCFGKFITIVGVKRQWHGALQCSLLW